MAHNTCSPARIYGPLPQTLFCGCSVLSFSSGHGWNEQSSSVTVELVQDTCVGPRVWYDKDLVRQSGNIADPGFIEPEPGCAVYFRMETNPDGATEAERAGIEYAGLVESWTTKYDKDGNPVYSVKIVDPRIVLENTQVIVNDFPGTTSGVWNLINAYGFVESLGSSCATSPAGAIGGVTSDNVIGNIANERGMSWNDIKCAVQTLTSAQNRATADLSYGGYCNDARLTYVGPTTGNDGYGILAKDSTITDPAFTGIANANLNVQYYTVDLTEIPFSPNYYKISGPNISLMEIISQVCQDAGCDYYIELLPVTLSSVLYKVIKVRVAIRSDQPQIGKLDSFIAAKVAENTAANGGVLNYTEGEEVRNEETSIYLMGGKVRSPYTAEASDIIPFWGVDVNGDLIQATAASGQYMVRMDFGRLNVSLATTMSSQYKWVSETELRAALVDIDSWKAVTLAVNGEIATHLRSIDQVPNFRFDVLKDVVEGTKPPAAYRVGLPDAIAIDHQVDSNGAKDLDKIYEFIRTYADEFYGKQFLVNHSTACYTTDAETGKYKYSHEPSTEGCWVNDGTATIIGLSHDTAASDFFRDEQGKYQPILKFPLTGASLLGGATGYIADPSKLGDTNYITDQVDEIWVKAEIDSRWVKGTPLDPAATTLSFLIKIGSPVTLQSTPTYDFIDSVAGIESILDARGETLAAAKPRIEYIDRGVGLASFPWAIAPSAAMCPLVSNVEVYGPWGVAGLPGQVILEKDDGFVPWEYGGDTTMYAAALDKVSNAVTQMRKGERGSITVAGFPEIPLGAELFSVDTVSPPTSQGTQKYYSTRVASTDTCAVLPYVYVAMNAWTGAYGPNVTQVNVQIGAGGFTTEYQFSTYTQQFGRFSKDNAERLKRIGQQRLSMMRNMRARSAQMGVMASSFMRPSAKGFIDKQIGVSARAPRSAHDFFIGRYTGSGRPEVHTQSSKNVSLSFQSDTVYANSALMSWDALLRPVSKAGSGGLPRYAESLATGDCTAGWHLGNQQPDPPVNEYTPLALQQDYFDPLSNPSGTVANLSDSPASGHDIEALGRGSAAPRSGWCIPECEQAGSGGYEDDYRFFALKGPIMLQQWGFDLQGKPIPNAIDNATNIGLGLGFEAYNLEDKFLNGFLQKPETWPVAPIDLRFDRARKVWTVPTPPRNVHVTPTGDCLYTYPVSYVNNIREVYDAAGNVVPNPTVNVEWPWTEIMPPLDIGKIPAYYDNVDCKYYAFPVNRFDAVVAGTTYKDTKKIVFGSGFSLASSSFNACERTLTLTASGASSIGVATAPCGTQTLTSVDTTVTGLNFVYGICAAAGSAADTVDVALCLGITGTTYTSSCSSNESIFSTVSDYDTIKFIGDISVSQDGCSVVVSGMSKFNMEGLTWCGGQGNTNDVSLTKLYVGSGLELNQYYDANGTIENCSYRVDMTHLEVGSAAMGGQSMTHDKNSNALVGPAPTWSCSNEVVPIVSDAGPYPNRKPPKLLHKLWAGRGIGFASCDDCDMIIFNNHIDVGFDSSCNNVYGYQIGKHTWEKDFVLTSGPEGGVGVDASDWTLDTAIALNEGGGTWELDVITSITCTKSGGYVTGLSIGCTKISGTKTCHVSNPKHWITSINGAGTDCGSC